MYTCKNPRDVIPYDLPNNPYRWNGSTVPGIPERMEYCKTHRQSYKIKKTIENPPEQ